MDLTFSYLALVIVASCSVPVLCSQLAPEAPVIRCPNADRQLFNMPLKDHVMLKSWLHIYATFTLYCTDPADRLPGLEPPSCNSRAARVGLHTNAEINDG